MFSITVIVVLNHKEVKDNQKFLHEKQKTGKNWKKINRQSFLMFCLLKIVK